ncbi:MAG TPA: SRPBCC family protein [Methylomirabilota bacterium]|nr:SRPBCC family protein [Methylomirabilota bacterium]
MWTALSDSTGLGTCFGMKFTGPFAPGALMRGLIVPTKVNEDVAKAQQEYAGMPVEITMEKMEPERWFSFRWHRYAIEKGVDYSAEPTTLIEFVIEEIKDGVMLTVTESGFDQIPVTRRVKAFTANEQGWGMVVKLIEEYLVRAK